jgi:hypothetical protein
MRWARKGTTMRRSERTRRVLRWAMAMSVSDFHFYAFWR